MTEREGQPSQPSLEPETPETKASEDALDYIRETAKELEPKLIQQFRDFHEHPELGGEEIETARKIKAYLEDLGIEIVGEGIGVQGKAGERTFEGTGIVAMIRGKDDGPTIALRADMDALPITENKDHEVQSKTSGVMHACGHDAHMAGLLGAAEILKRISDEGKLDGNVVLLFQPSEEKTHQKESGAVQMVKFLEEAGLRDKIGAFFGQHVMATMERGTVNIRPGVHMASSGEVSISLATEGGHIMDSRKLPNLKVIDAKITAKLDEIFEPLYREGKALIASPRTEFGGKGYNVLSPTADSTWVVRITSEMYRELSRDVLEKIRLAVSETVTEEMSKLDASVPAPSVQISNRSGYRPVIHRDPKLVELARDSVSSVIGERATQQDHIIFGGEDFSFYQERLKGKEIPGAYLLVGGANPDQGVPISQHHSPAFRIDERVVSELASIHSVFSLKAIEQLKKKE